MKLDLRTIQILKNFSTINPSLLFREGKTITTVSPQKTIMASATIKEEIPRSFAIYDLSRLLGVLSLFDQPELDIQESSMVISSGKQKVQYTFADPRMIVTSDAKGVNMPEAEIGFILTAEDLQKVQKALGVLQLPEIAVTGEGGEMYLEAIDSKNPSSDNYRVHLKGTEHNFRMIFKAENIKIMNGNYEVSITSKGIAQFKSDDVTYWVATEASSTFQ